MCIRDSRTVFLDVSVALDGLRKVVSSKRSYTKCALNTTNGWGPVAVCPPYWGSLSAPWVLLPPRVAARGHQGHPRTPPWRSLGANMALWTAMYDMAMTMAPCPWPWPWPDHGHGHSHGHGHGPGRAVNLPNVNEGGAGRRWAGCPRNSHRPIGFARETRVRPAGRAEL